VQVLHLVAGGVPIAGKEIGAETACSCVPRDRGDVLKGSRTLGPTHAYGVHLFRSPRSPGSSQIP
jgi:hypothetical protein